jgi:hypothetical protein
MRCCGPDTRIIIVEKHYQALGRRGITDRTQ